jgi:PadR family transcriptional regulator PadR
MAPLDLFSPASCAPSRSRVAASKPAEVPAGFGVCGEHADAAGARDIAPAIACRDYGGSVVPGAPLLLFTNGKGAILLLFTNRKAMAQSHLTIVPGTLEMLVLKTLSMQPMHGWGIGERIQQMSQDVFRVNHGTLYPALERLQRRGWIGAEWRVSENNRRARYYSITRSGIKQLEAEQRDWARASGAVNLILRTT